MKEFIAEAGGRYTYVDDVLNLQELALSMTTIFSQCDNFIVSGCEISDNNISPGYVWINGKIRYFEGCVDAVFPYYIFEKNSSESVVYANDVNKKGRINYLCAGSSEKPENPDILTEVLPEFIEVNPDYSPRFLDKFIGKFALLLNTPFSKQTIHKELIATGQVTGEKEIVSQKAISAVHPANNYSIKNLVKENGDGAVGLFLNGHLINEILFTTDGKIKVVKDGQDICIFDEKGAYADLSIADTSVAQTFKTESISIEDSNINNHLSNEDNGSVSINYAGYKGGTTKYRDFIVYDGKNSAVFKISGKDRRSYFEKGVTITGKTKTLVLETVDPNDKYNHASLMFSGDGKRYAEMQMTEKGFQISTVANKLILSNTVGVYITNRLFINDVNIADIYVSKKELPNELKGKVDVVVGKQLSTEDFTTTLKQKLENLNPGTIGTTSTGYVTATHVTDVLKEKASITSNLSDLKDKGVARKNLDVYSISEANGVFLKVSGKLTELVALSAQEINDLTPEEASALKAKKQEEIRNTLDAEKKGTGELKLNKTSNLADLSDKPQARKNISVYSTTEIDNLLKGKLDSGTEYKGVVFTEDLKKKLDSIVFGNFAYTDNNNVSHSKKEGFVTTSQVQTELDKKANLLMTGYSSSQKETIATNLGIYTTTAANGRFATLSSNFQDYINMIVQGGKTTAEAQKTLRDKLDCPSKSDVSNTYLTKGGKLSDLNLPDAAAKKQACNALGAAFAADYQPKINDTGWLQMQNSGSSTDTRNLFVRQIGNIVCIQGTINTAKKDGSNQGGVVAILPNQIEAPKYGIRNALCDFNDKHQYNRGASFMIKGNTRKILIYESGWLNMTTEINFTYMV